MAWRRSRVRIPYAPLKKKQGNPTDRLLSLLFLCFSAFFFAVSGATYATFVTKILSRISSQNQRSLPRISPIDISDAPYLDIFRPGVFLKRRFRLTEQLIERNLFLKAIDHRQNISRILREHGAGGIRHGRAENPLVIG